MLSHFSESRMPRMVDVTGKEATLRRAHAIAVVVLPEEVLALLADGDVQSPKGPVFQTAVVAGVMAAKKTSELIPMCHPIGLDDCTIDIDVNAERRVEVHCRTAVRHRTGVEMEALTGATVAALTIYDMCKSVSHDIVIREVRLLEKRGGKSDVVAHPGQRNGGGA